MSFFSSDPLGVIKFFVFTIFKGCLALNQQGVDEMVRYSHYLGIQVRNFLFDRFFHPGCTAKPKSLPVKLKFYNYFYSFWKELLLYPGVQIQKKHECQSVLQGTDESHNSPFFCVTWFVVMGYPMCQSLCVHSKNVKNVCF